MPPFCIHVLQSWTSCSSLWALAIGLITVQHARVPQFPRTRDVMLWQMMVLSIESLVAVAFALVLSRLAACRKSNAECISESPDFWCMCGRGRGTRVIRDRLRGSGNTLPPSTTSPKRFLS